MASIQNPYYVSGSGRSYGDGIASIAQALLSGPSPDQIAAQESDMRYRDALAGKATAETGLLTDKRAANAGVGGQLRAILGDNAALPPETAQALANVGQALFQGDASGELGGVLRALIANSGLGADATTYAMAGAGTPLADNEALTEGAQAEKLRLAEEAATGRTRITADYGLRGTLGAAEIGERGASERQRADLEWKARQPVILNAGQTILPNDLPAFGGAGQRPAYTARDLAAEATTQNKRMELDAKAQEPIPLSADQSLVTPGGQKLVTAPGSLKAAIGEITQDASGRTLEGPPDPTGNGGKDPLDISPDETAKLGFAMDDFATAAGGVLDGATKARLTERAAQLYQQTRNSGTAAAQAWREIMGQEPAVEDNWFSDNKVSPQRPIPGVNAADTAQYDGAAPAAEAPPPMEARKPGMIVQTPRGPMMWTGTGWKPAT